MTIIPTILEHSMSEVKKKLALVRDIVARVQIDIVDGYFADNLTITPRDLLGFDFGDCALDIHLMTLDPTDFVEECAQLRDRVTGLRIIGQIERMGNIEEFLRQAREAGGGAGLALDLYTPSTSIPQDVFLDLDCVLQMSVKAGKQGELFQSRAIANIRELYEVRGKIGSHCPIIVDGGLSPAHMRECKAAGADEFVVGKWIWKQKDIAEALANV